MEDISLRGNYTDYPDYKRAETFIISGPIGVAELGVDLFGNIYLGRGGRVFKSLEAALSWVAKRFKIVEVVHDAETYGNRWAFRVARVQKRR